MSPLSRLLCYLARKRRAKFYAWCSRNRVHFDWRNVNGGQWLR